MRLPLEYSSNIYEIKLITEEDFPEALALCRENRSYYELTKTAPTQEALQKLFTDLPQGASQEDKFFAGYYQDGELIALIDLITRHPLSSAACINWFMVKKDRQKAGVGSRIIEELLFFLMQSGIEYVRLNALEEDADTMRFWISNGFSPTLKETAAGPASCHITEMERQLFFPRPM